MISYRISDEKGVVYLLLSLEGHSVLSEPLVNGMQGIRSPRGPLSGRVSIAPYFVG